MEHALSLQQPHLNLLQLIKVISKQLDGLDIQLMFKIQNGFLALLLPMLMLCYTHVKLEPIYFMRLFKEVLQKLMLHKLLSLIKIFNSSGDWLQLLQHKLYVQLVFIKMLQVTFGINGIKLPITLTSQHLSHQIL